MARVTAELLAACLADVESGRLSVDECVAKYPTAGEELRGMLELAASLDVPARVVPDAAFVARTRAALIVAVNSGKTRKTRLAAWRGGLLRTLGMPASIAAVVLALSFGGAGVVQASQDALPGDALYPVKTVIEDARLALASDDEAKAQTYLDIATARLNEVEQARLQGKTRAVEVASNALAAATANIERHIEKAAGAGHDVAGLSARLAQHAAREEKAKNPVAAAAVQNGKGETKGAVGAQAPDGREAARPEAVSAQSAPIGAGSEISATAALTQAIAEVQRLATADMAGQSYKGLLAKLDAADAALRRGQHEVAARNLDAFADELAAMARSGRLAEQDYDALYLRYTALVRSLGETPKEKARSLRPNGGNVVATPTSRRPDGEGTAWPDGKPASKDGPRDR